MKIFIIERNVIAARILAYFYLSLHYMAQKQLFAVSFYSEYLLHLVNTSMLVEVYANWIMPGYVCLNSMTRSWNYKVALDLLQQVLNKIYSNSKFIELKVSYIKK